MKKILLLIGILAMVAFFLLRNFFIPSDQDRIKRKFNQISQLATVDKVEVPLKRVAKAKKLGKFFTKEVTIHIVTDNFDKVVLKKRNELESKFLILRSKLAKLMVTFSDISITLQGQNAQAHLTMVAEGQLQGRSEEFLEGLELKVGFVKVNDDWLIEGMENIATIK